MFGLGFGELVVICLVIVLLFGPQALPDIVRTIAKAFKKFKEEVHKIGDELNSEDQGPARKDKKA